MLELKPRPTTGSPRAQAARESQQPRRLLLALVLLLVALAGVLWRDRGFWFGSDQALLDSSEASEPSVAPRRVAKSAASAVGPTASAPAKKNVVGARNSAEPKPADAPAAETIRTVLPPLDVEVVAGDTHRTLHPGSNAAKVEITHREAVVPAQSTANLAVATNAAELEPLATDALRPPTQSYPLLAKHMNVQGSVVLQALIGADGVVQNLHVLTGPAILASAAQQAVREWRFKPILQNGQPVETKADITVNFTIKVADSSEKTTLAESRASDNLIITR